VATRALILEDADEAMLAGEQGPACALAMRMVVAVARGMRATRLLDITGAHIDGCIYYGRVCLDWALRFRQLGARVRVPTTLNIGLLDLIHPGLTDVPDEQARPARELMEAYVELGAEPTFTCAPYQLAGSRPGLGEHVAWAESNAIVFANSVLGARTNRYGDFCDVACAITGRAPAAGLHLTAERRARVVLVVFRPHLHQFVDAIESRERFAHLRSNRGDLHERNRHQANEEGVHHKVAQRHRALEDRPAAHDDHHHANDPGDHCRAGVHC
jgi:predicted aconitase